MLTSTVIHFLRECTRRRALGLALGLGLGLGFGLGLLAPGAAGAQWRFTAPPAAGAWYATLDSLRLDGAGAFPFHRTAGPSARALARTLAASPRFEILHFVPLYYPSATRESLTAAVREAATSAEPSQARAQFLVAALRRALPAPEDRTVLPALAELTRTVDPVAIPATRLDRWQQRWDTRFAPALARYLASERLDGGIVIVADALGPEGRLFTGLPAGRYDNLMAVGTSLAPGDDDGPLFAVVREACFPLVSRAADAAPGFGRDRAAAARRTSLAAVRCGAELLDRVLPAEAGAYRAHWQLAADAGGRRTFDTLFPPDTALAPRLRTMLDRFAPAP
ncbi:MAG: hypothetical protein ACYC3L_03415 [Gemmatimonadaceae bacterium]